jgi:hypothetical protein
VVDVTWRDLSRNTEAVTQTFERFFFFSGRVTRCVKLVCNCVTRQVSREGVLHDGSNKSVVAVACVEGCSFFD